MLLVYLGFGILAWLVVTIWRGFYLLKKFTFRDPKKLLAKAKEYNRKGISVLVNIAAEGCRNAAGARSLMADYIFVIDCMDEEAIDGCVSIKPASFVPASLPADKKMQCFETILAALAQRAAESNRKVWLDEERSSDEAWVEPVKRSAVLDRKFPNLSWRVRCYLKNSPKRVSEYLAWHRMGARFGIGLCRGAYAADRELGDVQTEAQTCLLAEMLIRENIDCAVASHTMWIPLFINEGRLFLHMLHGRKEVGEILESELIKKYARERAVYMIWGRDWRSLLPYVFRRLREKPSIFWRD